MATKRQVETRLRALIDRLDQTEEGKAALSQALPDPRVVQVHVPDLDATYWTQLADGRMGTLHRGTADRPDIRLEAQSDDLVEVLDGRRSMFSAYVAGRMRIDASFSDILRLRKLA